MKYDGCVIDWQGKGTMKTYWLVDRLQAVEDGSSATAHTDAQRVEMN